MPDYREFFGEPGGSGNGGNARALDVFEHRGLPWALVFEHTWRVPVTYKDVSGPHVLLENANLAFTAGQNTDGTLRITFSGDALEDDVTVDIVVAAADADTDISLEAETVINADPTLSGLNFVAADNGGDVDVGMPGHFDISFEWVPDWQTWSVQFGGVIVDGTYATTFLFDGYTPIVVPTVRAAGTPVDEAALAVEHEADIEGNPLLAGLVVSADDDTVDTNEIIFETGAPDVVVTCTAPGTATLTPTETTGEVEVAQLKTATLNLNGLSPRGRFPRGVDRGVPAVTVLEEWGAGVTLTVGEANGVDNIYGSTPLDLDVLARDIGDAAATEALPRYEAALEPTATIFIGDPATLTQGRLMIELGWTPTP